MSISGTQWSASEFLDVGVITDDFRCFGFAITMGRRCRNPIAKANRQLATVLLSQLSEFGAPSAISEHMLQLLAGLLLCKRWHGTYAPKDQSSCVVQNWLGKIQNSTEASPIIRNPPHRITLNPPHRATPDPPHRITPNPPHRITPNRMRDLRPILPSPRQEPPTEGRRNEPHQTSVASNNRSSSEFNSRGPRQEQIAEEQQHESTQSRNVSIRQPDPDFVSPSPRQEPQIEEQPNQPVQTIQNSLSNTSLGQEISEEDGQSSEPGRRNPSRLNDSSSRQETEEPNESGPRPVDGDCPICLEDLNSGDGVIWCKAQCGQNFHRDCINTWLDNNVAHKTCAYWWVIFYIYAKRFTDLG